MWLKWILITLFALDPIATTALIGKPRKAYTPSDAVASILIKGGLIVLVLIYWPEC